MSSKRCRDTPWTHSFPLSVALSQPQGERGPLASNEPIKHLCRLSCSAVSPSTYETTDAHRGGETAREPRQFV